MMKIVWQCSECGVVHNTKLKADDCCGGYGEKSNRCTDCGQLYYIGIAECNCKKG